MNFFNYNSRLNELDCELLRLLIGFLNLNLIH